MDPYRWGVEKDLLRLYMWAFVVRDLADGGAEVEGWAQTSGGQNRYSGRLVLSPNFPYEEPKLYVTSPNPMWMHGWQKTVNSLGLSGAFRTRTNGPNGCVQICHTDLWDASMTCVLVLEKLHLWLEAYEAHLRSGKEIMDYLHRN